MPGWYLGRWFAIHCPDEQPHGVRRVLRRCLPLFLLSLIPIEIVSVAGGLGQVSPALFSWTTAPVVGAAGALMRVAFWVGRRHSSGELRQRFGWLLGSFALMWSVSCLTWLGQILEDADIFAWLQHAAVLGSLLALVGLTYAILRHRVLDRGLALKRSLVFTVVGAVRLGSVHFLNVLLGRLLHFDDPAKAGLLGAVPAALVVLAHPKVKARAEWVIDRFTGGAGAVL